MHEVPKYPLIAAAVSVALLNTTEHPADTDTREVAVHAVAPPHSDDGLDEQPELATIERARGEQEPLTSRALGPQTATFTQGGLSPVVSYDLRSVTG